MDVAEALQTYRAVHAFTQQPVEDAVLHSLMEAASLAPNPMKFERAFCIVDRAARLREIAAPALAFARSMQAAGLPQATELDAAGYDLFHGASAMIVVCAMNDSAAAAEDCSAVAAALVLAAHAQQIGACWIASARPWLNLVSSKIELGIPWQWHPVAPIAIGQPQLLLQLQEPRSPTTPRRIWCR